MQLKKPVNEANVELYGMYVTETPGGLSTYDPTCSQFGNAVDYVPGIPVYTGFIPKHKTNYNCDSPYWQGGRQN